MILYRNLIILSAILFKVELSFSQEITAENLISSKVITIGKIYNKDISATEIQLPENIYNLSNDSLGNEIILLLRKVSGKYYKNKGYLVALRKNDLKVLWFKEVSDFEMFNTDSLVLLSNVEKKRTTCYNKHNGSVLWKNDHLIRFIDKKNNLGFNKFFRVIDLATGKIKWEKKIDSEFGWNGIEYVTDSTLILASSGIHYFNLMNGKDGIIQWQQERMIIPPV